jgi:DNA-binding transcriptional MerR regulator
VQIGELSARTGATGRMLRYYEEQGLLEPRRTASGYRVYSESDVLRVRYIRCMLSSALPAGVVAQALRFLLDGRPAVPEVPAERARLASTLQAELDSLTERIDLLNQSRAQLERFVRDIREDAVGPGQPEPVPDEAMSTRDNRLHPVARNPA